MVFITVKAEFNDGVKQEHLQICNDMESARKNYKKFCKFLKGLTETNDTKYYINVWLEFEGAGHRERVAYATIKDGEIISEYQNGVLFR